MQHLCLYQCLPYHLFQCEVLINVDISIFIFILFSTGIQYAFSQFSGTLLASTVYFLIYCLVKRNRPDLYPEAVGPGFLSGVLWAVADVGWFVANTYLSEAISFPIVTTGPGIIASIWGVFVFKEITGWKNFLLLGVALCFAVSASLVTGFSK